MKLSKIRKQFSVLHLQQHKIYCIPHIHRIHIVLLKQFNMHHIALLLEVMQTNVELKPELGNAEHSPNKPFKLLTTLNKMPSEYWLNTHI